MNKSEREAIMIDTGIYETCISAEMGDCEIANGIKALRKNLVAIEADRDKWKKRAAALERAHFIGRPCYVCKYQNYISGMHGCQFRSFDCSNKNRTYPRFEFDDARFAEEEA
jgi:hypothetical protein